MSHGNRGTYFYLFLKTTEEQGNNVLNLKICDMFIFFNLIVF